MNKNINFISFQSLLYIIIFFQIVLFFLIFGPSANIFYGTVNLELGDFVHTFGDAHIYSNHYEQANLQLSRELKSLPTMKINPDVKNIFDFKYEDFELTDYEPHPHIKAPVAI